MDKEEFQEFLNLNYVKLDRNDYYGNKEEMIMSDEANPFCTGYTVEQIYGLYLNEKNG